MAPSEVVPVKCTIHFSNGVRHCMEHALAGMLWVHPSDEQEIP